MTVNYIGKKTVIRDSFKEYAEKRLKKLGKFFDDDPVVNIIVTNHNEDETVEVTIQSHGMFFRAERTSDDRQTSLAASIGCSAETDCPQQRAPGKASQIRNGFYSVRYS